MFDSLARKKKKMKKNRKKEDISIHKRQRKSDFGFVLSQHYLTKWSLHVRERE